MTRKPQSTQPELGELPLIHPHAAGLDIGLAEIWVAVPAGSDPQPVRAFPTFTPDLLALADWLKTCGVTSVAMESTGVYWIPIYELLEARGFEVYLVNARHLRGVPGRKSDVQDCQWIQRLHGYGLLSASFRPEAEMVVLRAYRRASCARRQYRRGAGTARAAQDMRASLIEHRAAHILHMQKALAQMNVQLTQVLTDITGETGMQIIRAIVAGQYDPVTLAQFRDKRCKHSQDEIAKALTGNYRHAHLFSLKQALTLYDTFTAQIAECDVVLEQQFSALKPSHDQDELPPLDTSDKRDSHSQNAPNYDARTLLYQKLGVDLVALRGMNASTVQTILTEVGISLDRFPDVKHFCSWLHLAPHQAISGGKVLHTHVLKGPNRAGQAFRLAAQSLMRSQCEFGAYLRRMRARMGPEKAIVATAHKLARAFYYMLKERRPYRGESAAQSDARAREREIARLTAKAKKLGLELVQPAAQPATG